MSDLSTLEFAKLTGKHPGTIRLLLRNGKLNGVAYKIGATWRIRREAVDQLRGVPGVGVQGKCNE